MNRTCYCPETSRAIKVCAWAKHLRQYQPTPKRDLRLRQAALLILDMQRYFLDETSRAFVPQAPLIVPALVQLQQHFLKHHRPVIQTAHHDEPETSPMCTWWQGRLRLQDPCGEIHPALKEVRAKVILKSAYSAFFGTTLLKELRSKNIQQLVVGGVLTHLCCETTIRDAFMHGFDVAMLMDGMATYTEELHVGSLSALSHGFATPYTCEDIFSALQRDDAALRGEA